jgi:hypothetical protein
MGEKSLLLINYCGGLSNFAISCVFSGWKGSPPGIGDNGLYSTF